MKKFLLQFAGWLGVLMIVSAYLLISFDLINSNTLMYQVLNLAGAFAIGIEAFSKRDYQPVVLQIVWAIIALIAILQIIY